MIARLTYLGLLDKIGADGALLASVFLAVLVYLSLIFLLRAVGKDELSMLPFWGKIAKKHAGDGVGYAL